MSTPAARQTDPAKHDSAHGNVTSGSGDVWIGGLPAARTLLDQVTCSDHGPSPISTGSATVLINALPAARCDDQTVCGARIVHGCESVYIGGATVALQTCDCDPPEENFPYKDGTFEYIRSIAPQICEFSELNGVSPVAVAGSIADEFNTRGLIDRFQDHVLLPSMTDAQVQLDVDVGIPSKYLNATYHDLGKGNIQLKTAREMYEKYPDQFPDMTGTWPELVDHLTSDEGTAQVAALYIRHAEGELNRTLGRYGQALDDYPLQDREALLVTFYKQGPKFLKLIENKLKLDPNARVRAGEGCRVCLQSERLLDALSSAYSS